MTQLGLKYGLLAAHPHIAIGMKAAKMVRKGVKVI